MSWRLAKRQAKAIKHRKQKKRAVLTLLKHIKNALGENHGDRANT